MNKYRISKDVDIDKSESVMGIQTLPTNFVKVGLPAIPFVGVPLTGVMVLKELADSDVREIKTIEELDTFSCTSDEWSSRCIYVEHPIISKRLIESRMYKDYILKELMSDIFNYITDRIAVKKITIGLMSIGKFDAGATIPIKDVVVEATTAGCLDSNYQCTMEDVDCTNDDNKEYPWIKYHPDIVAAVQKNAGKLEITQSVKMELDVNLGLKDVVKGAFKNEKEYKFYVYYEKA